MSNPEGTGQAQVRVIRPQRSQMEWREFSLETFIRADDRVRIVWRYVEKLDLEPLYQEIRTLEGSAGRDAIDPRILLALWLYAKIEKVSSARELSRLTERDLA